MEQQVDSEVRIRKELEKEITELQSKEKERAKLEWKQTAKEFQSKEKKIIQTIVRQRRLQFYQEFNGSGRVVHNKGCRVCKDIWRESMPSCLRVRSMDGFYHKVLFK